MTGGLIDALDTPAEVAAALLAHRRERLRVGCERFLLVAQWCDTHPPEDVRFGQQVGADGTPKLAQFAVEELSCLEEIHPHAARVAVADTLNLRHRHPRLWRRIEAGEVVDWLAVKTARLVAAAELTRDQARWVDAETADDLMALPVGRYLARVEAKIIEADQAGAEARRQAEMEARFVRKGRRTEHGLKGLYARGTFGEINYFYAVIDRIAQILGLQGDPDPIEVRRSKALVILAVPQRAIELFAWAQEQAEQVDDPGRNPADLVPPTPSTAPRPASTIHVHVSAEAVAAGFGVARVEEVGPIALAAVRELLGHTQVTVRPVLDLTRTVAVDGYEIPTSLKEAVHQAFPFEVFPWGTLPSRASDKDHSTPYLPLCAGGQPGQTSTDNLAPLGRRAHRIKTFGKGWRHIRVGPRTFLWRTPTGYWYRVDPDGTHALGKQISVPEEQLAALVRAA